MQGHSNFALYVPAILKVNAGAHDLPSAIATVKAALSTPVRLETFPRSIHLDTVEVDPVDERPWTQTEPNPRYGRPPLYRDVVETDADGLTITELKETARLLAHIAERTDPLLWDQLLIFEQRLLMARVRQAVDPAGPSAEQHS
ncbi:hypothetical protein KGQ20_04150 [Catenulispora sp. NF23]|uniref:Uncharacterized protein n=1 Tax=Catenulispora pinistramenti TaxID=2705254 RepID=A0ABS5KJA2_9ACTN|nr:hypothetical protein [Catenulispora pinistramenti]MBS2531956.1 hypothetical protein [Catenulispora pinistramenti]MBS2546223.1 hypothetical protein [Catenulispora pinistramenti]